MVQHWNVIGRTVQGDSHRIRGVKRQDWIKLRNHEKMVFLAVADGHGGAQYTRSGKGAWIAVNVAYKVLKSFVRQVGKLGASEINALVSVDLPRKIVQEWRERVLLDDLIAHREVVSKKSNNAPGVKNPEDIYQLYGTTLVVVVLTRKFRLYLQLGDGDIMELDKGGNITRHFERHPNHLGNSTTSLCSMNAVNNMFVDYQPSELNSPVMITVSSDGYNNSFETEEDFHQVIHDLTRYFREYGKKFILENLRDWLQITSAEGSGDDITMGILYDKRHILNEVQEIGSRSFGSMKEGEIGRLKKQGRIQKNKHEMIHEQKPGKKTRVKTVVNEMRKRGVDSIRG